MAKQITRSIQIDDVIYVWSDTIAFIDKKTGEEISIQECRNRWKAVKNKWKRQGWSIDYNGFFELFDEVADKSK